MQTSMQSILFESLLLPLQSQNHRSILCRSSISVITSSFTFNQNRVLSTTPEVNLKNSALANYLIGTLKFPKDGALSVCSSFGRTKSLKNLKEVVHFLKDLGLSDADILSIAHGVPSILFANVEKTLKPKVTYLQELGLSGPTLCSLISKNHMIWGCNLDRTLKPCIHIISKILISDGRYNSEEQVSDDLVRILSRCTGIVCMKSRLEANITYLESCGVVGSQLSSLLRRQPELFGLPKEKLEELVSRAVDMKFAIGSKMLADAIRILCRLSTNTLNVRFEMLRMFGFSNDEIASIFRSAPRTFELSEENLRCKLEFFLNNLKMDKLVLVRNPNLFSFSLEKRVIPRCKVVEILKLRGLLEEDFSFTKAMKMSDELFLEKYIQPFKIDSEELVLAATTPEVNLKNSVLADYLIGSLNFPKDRAFSLCSRFSRSKSLENPREVVHFLKSLDLSDANIQSIAHGVPKILFADVERNLKPKVTFFQELGISGPTLYSLISRNPNILNRSLDRTLKPCLHSISKILTSDGRYKSKGQVGDDLVRILTKCTSIVCSKPRLEANITYLESCGVVGSQLSTLLLRQPTLFSRPKEELEDIVARAVDMKFSMGSRMLVHAIHILSCLSTKTLNGKFEVLSMFEFSKDEIASMFRGTPQVFGLSEENLRSTLDFFLNYLKLDKSVIVRNPPLLGLSLEKRVIPRCKVLEILKSRGLLSEDFSFTGAMYLSNDLFLRRYIRPFKDDSEESELAAYEGKLVDTCEV